MPIFTLIATAIVGAIGITGIAATIATGLIAGGLAIGVSKLIGPRANGNSQQEDSVTGARVQLPPATNNKLPVVYGTAFIGGSITDAKISSDLQTMWYVIAMADVTDSGGYTFDQIYYDNKLVTFGVDGKVESLTTNTAGTPEVDTKIAGSLYIYLFTNGSYSGVNTGGLSAIDIMTDAGIPADQNWASSLYTSDGQSPTMSNTAFVIVKVKYNQDAGTTSLGAITAKITNTLTKPGDCMVDYLTNNRYGCSVPLSAVNTLSFDELNDYSDKPIVYTPAGGGSPTTQVRYRFNGPVDTSKNCLSNLQDMVDACDSWMQYSELTGQWKVVINKAYDETPDSVTIEDLYQVNNNNLVSGISVTPSDLNQTYNQVEYQYPNTNIKDQLDYIFISLQDDYPALLSENEPVNKLTIKSELVNNYVQAKFISIRRLLQSREDLIISFQTDYSGIQVEAGDVIRVTNEVYGWEDKLFRVNNVIEEKYPDGSLGTRMSAFEYNGSIYDDDLDITDYIPEANTGLQDPNIIGVPDSPQVTVQEGGTINVMTVCGTVPTQGLVTQLDFNYGTSSNSATHLYYTSINNANGAPLSSGSTSCIDATELAANNYYWSVTARNTSVGVRSGSSNVASWNGPGVTIANTVTTCNANSIGTLVTCDSVSNLTKLAGAIVTVSSGTGNLAANTTIANVVSSTQFNLSSEPTIALANACLTIQYGGIISNNVQANGISYTNLAPYAPGRIYTDDWDISDYGYSQDARYRTVFNNPFSITGSTVTQPANTIYWPYGQGTATTAQGFVANSTGPFNPINNGTQVITNGDYGWYIHSVLDLTSDPLNVDEALEMNFATTVGVDVSGIHLQYCPFGIGPSTPAGKVNLFTNQQFDKIVTVTGSIPIGSFREVHEYYTFNLVTGPLNYYGMMVRNLSANTVYFDNNSFTGRQVKL